MFYLNYVGCKGCRTFFNFIFIFRFTLTMWDVKFFIREILKQAIIRFTLTMWDVKSIINQIVNRIKTVLP